MPQYQENCSIERIEQLSKDFYRLTLRCPMIAAHAQPGQFVMVACGLTLDPLLRRPFSIHHCTQDGTLQLLFKVIGRGTQLLSECRTGQSLSLIGPLGHGFRLQPGRPVSLVGGGIGIAPLRFLVHALQQAGGAGADCTVFLGSRSGDELAPLAMEFSALGCQVHTATDDGSLGHHGFITELLAPELSRFSKVYTCGPHPMMATVAALCHSAGVACEVSLEAHMACGLGACLGCTVHGTEGQYLHVCKQGPVLDAQEVAWIR
ncbi:oxidoreductase FAD/NAD(P)-binding domain protein [Desulfobulbus propionicus DSM 2032]|jgi:dihydroorotate dehydrogenase electron transfer subunit|uniref:Dihydroorotate dehydrogenase B (NAD(+)), electron transfer subunit n=1 Tax=Desulfobulbus propionicus (strain ATCC 33891 / DSM 2032 / VKM B-1956 / 1pr3) TaxID=577650 RepID=A0A7U4DMX7_DESPD|nr:dihydroorotate dehydrogenase electron transfer subunit [Desulfobulbus propionicus]ADW16477.1 oxidoreductase FAD/NAD(P)-binding domain protein [Desulfobulbus propionicus DSM 2032]